VSQTTPARAPPLFSSPFLPPKRENEFAETSLDAEAGIPRLQSALQSFEFPKALNAESTACFNNLPAF
jgi:hypothetical protein